MNLKLYVVYHKHETVTSLVKLGTVTALAKADTPEAACALMAPAVGYAPAELEAKDAREVPLNDLQRAVLILQGELMIWLAMQLQKGVPRVRLVD